MAKRSIHQPQSNYSDWLFLLFVGFVGLIGLGTVVSFFFLPFFGLVEEPRAIVEMISTNQPAISGSNDLPTDEVVGKLVEQTNGLVRVHDVGGTVSFQSTSSNTSAPVAPENPYLK